MLRIYSEILILFHVLVFYFSLYFMFYFFFAFYILSIVAICRREGKLNSFCWKEGKAGFLEDNSFYFLGVIFCMVIKEGSSECSALFYISTPPIFILFLLLPYYALEKLLFVFLLYIFNRSNILVLLIFDMISLFYLRKRKVEYK